MVRAIIASADDIVTPSAEARKAFIIYIVTSKTLGAHSIDSSSFDEIANAKLKDNRAARRLWRKCTTFLEDEVQRLQKSNFAERAVAAARGINFNNDMTLSEFKFPRLGDPRLAEVGWLYDGAPDMNKIRLIPNYSTVKSALEDDLNHLNSFWDIQEPDYDNKVERAWVSALLSSSRNSYTENDLQDLLRNVNAYFSQEMVVDLVWSHYQEGVRPQLQSYFTSQQLDALEQKCRLMSKNTPATMGNRVLSHFLHSFKKARFQDKVSSLFPSYNSLTGSVDELKEKIVLHKSMATSQRQSIIKLLRPDIRDQELPRDFEKYLQTSYRKVTEALQRVGESLGIRGRFLGLLEKQLALLNQTFAVACRESETIYLQGNWATIFRCLLEEYITSQLREWELTVLDETYVERIGPLRYTAMNMIAEGQGGLFFSSLGTAARMNIVWYKDNENTEIYILDEKWPLAIIKYFEDSFGPQSYRLRPQGVGHRDLVPTVQQWKSWGVDFKGAVTETPYTLKQKNQTKQ